MKPPQAALEEGALHASVPPPVDPVDAAEYRALADAMPQIVWITDSDGQLTWVNERFLEYTGLSMEQALAGAWRDTIHPDDGPVASAKFRDAIARGTSCEFEYRLKNRDGAYRWHLGRVVPVRRGEARPSVWFGTGTDIDERRSVEDELRASEHRFHAAFHRNPQAICLTRLSDGVFLDVNEAFARMTGYARQELLGRSSTDIGAIAGERRSDLVSPLFSNEPLRDLEIPYRNKDGKNLTLLVSAERIELEGVPCVLSVLSDETARRATERALAQREAEARAQAEELHVILDTTPAAVWIADDPECRVVRGSRAGHEMLRMPMGANLSKTAVDTTPSNHFKIFKDGVELRPEELPLQRAAREGVEIRGLLEEVRFENGDTIHVLGNAVPLRDENGEPRGAIAAFVDITPIKEAEAAHREADRRKDEFLAMLSHELRNPLAPIVTAVQLMKLRGNAGDTRELAVIERQAKHLMRLVDDLLDVSRIARGKVVLDRARIELSRIVANAVETAAPLLEQRRHELSIDVAVDGLAVEGDETRLTQVVSNLLTNAARYTPAGGAVSVSARREGNEIVLVVRDNGLGISAALLPKVFELFVQGERRPDRTEGGLGLGLSLVKSLTSLHGGRVEAKSEGEGRGSTFTVHLPAAMPHRRDPRERETVSSGIRSRSRSCRILLVDDNADAADLLGSVLSAEGHDVHVVNDAVAALSELSTFHPEIAILDIGLPVMDGYALGAEMRRRLGAKAPVMLSLTGYGSDLDRKRTTEQGFVSHLVKPVDTNHLVGLIRAILAGADSALAEG